ncbi:MAG: hypothetical protein ACP5J5_06145 [Dissulfurimicrobium sp.]|uniref:hypothetical protein n=1 Tax=Dissulfurimicrobium TaxID=1769732 RepID=UPI003C72AD17
MDIKGNAALDEGDLNHTTNNATAATGKEASERKTVQENWGCIMGCATGTKVKYGARPFPERKMPKGGNPSNSKDRTNNLTRGLIATTALLELININILRYRMEWFYASVWLKRPLKCRVLEIKIVLEANDLTSFVARECPVI